MNICKGLIIFAVPEGSFHLCVLHVVCRYWAMPAFWLKRQIMLNLPSENLECNVANSVDFMVERVSWGSDKETCTTHLVCF